MRDVIVVGGGAGGLAAAIKAHGAGRDVLLIEREEELGGILMQCIHNGFGLEVFDHEYTGPEYADRYIRDFLSAGIDHRLHATVSSITKNGDVFTVRTSSPEEGLTEHQAKAVILTTGCYERTRGSIQIPGDRPKGVLTAGTAQRYINIDGFMPGKRVFVLGSGDIGLIMARRMRLEGAEVLGVAEIMPHSNGLNRNIVQCLRDYDIIADDAGNLAQIVVQKVDEHFDPVPGSDHVYDVDLLLLAIGLIPEVSIIDDLGVAMDPRTKSVAINQAYETTVPGLFVAGNALQVHDLVDKVSKESERAGLAASAYLEQQGRERREIAIVPGDNVAYVTPQRIDLNLEGTDTVLALRSTREIEKATLTIRKADHKESLFEKRLAFVLPAEMTMVSVPTEQLDDDQHDLVVDLEVSA
jgi:NADPH-dependent 2,4-dienoyl-CoA reductase/sulfur reductase-like enzyme